MSKFIWQNGSQIEPAKVQIGDTSYEVTPAQYEGETPLSAANLNTMIDNIYSDLQEYADNSPIKNNDYSTEEKVIGTWIDGKPLYRKTVSFKTGSSTDTWMTISGLTNIKDIPCYSGYIYMSDTETFLVPSPNANNCPYFSINKSSHTIREAHTNNNCNNKTCVITFNYTKTTDTVS